MDLLQRNWGTLIAIFLSALYIFLQLLQWRKHGDDLTLITASIIITALLWVVLIALIWKYWRTPRAIETAPASANVSPGTAPKPVQPAPPVTAIFPSISSLQGTEPPQLTDDGVKEWFRHAYYSPLTAEVEQNIRIVARTNQPNNPEQFYSRFIGVGLVAYFHDMTWANIFKSQLLLLADLIHRRVPVPLNEAKIHYDVATKDCPKIYPKYSFNSWLAYLEGNS